MEIRPFRQYKQLGNLIQGLFLVILFSGVFLLTKDYAQDHSISWLGMSLVILYFTILFIYANFFSSGVRCPKCKTKCFPGHKFMEDEKGIWLQIQFPCEKCNIIWDTQDQINLNQKGRYFLK